MDGSQIPDASLRSLHGAGLLTAIGLLVAVCGFGLQAFLGHLGAASAQAGEPSRPPQPAATSAPAAPDTGYQPPPRADFSPAPDQQAAFLESIRLSGTGGWSSRLDILTYGVRACRLLADGQQPPDVVGSLVEAGEPAAQANAVVTAAPDTLCPV